MGYNVQATSEIVWVFWENTRRSETLRGLVLPSPSAATAPPQPKVLKNVLSHLIIVIIKEDQDQQQTFIFHHQINNVYLCFCSREHAVFQWCIPQSIHLSIYPSMVTFHSQLPTMPEISLPALVEFRILLQQKQHITHYGRGSCHWQPFINQKSWPKMQRRFTAAITVFHTSHTLIALWLTHSETVWHSVSVETKKWKEKSPKQIK